MSLIKSVDFLIRWFVVFSINIYKSIAYTIAKIIHPPCQIYNAYNICLNICYNICYTLKIGIELKQ
jgi:hypothetical protein